MILSPDPVTTPTAAILQARTGSSRLPGKVLADLGGRPLLAFLIERLQRCRAIDHILLATTDQPADDGLVALAQSLGVTVVRGSEHDVLARFALAAASTTAATLVRVTGDCPLVDPELLTMVIEAFHRQGVDYLSNCVPPSYPDGLDLEVFSRQALVRAHAACTSAAQREHVTPWMRESGQLRTGCVMHRSDLSALRWTVDEPEDLAVIRAVVDNFGGRSDFSWLEVLELHHQQPHLFVVNARFARNEGASLGEGQKLWRGAKRVIRGGNMLISKLAEMF
ncbi:MAG: cytidylyltransferase domain-containing protein, partial [Cyanobacteriota bacterium]